MEVTRRDERARMRVGHLLRLAAGVASAAALAAALVFPAPDAAARLRHSWHLLQVGGHLGGEPDGGRAGPPGSPG